MANGRVTITVPDDVAYAVDVTTDISAVDNALNTGPDGAHRIAVETDNGEVNLNGGQP